MAGYKFKNANLLIKKGLEDYNLIAFLNESHECTKHT